MARPVVLLASLALLAGCGAARQIILEETADVVAPISLSEALAHCRNGFPDQIVEAVPRAECIVKATESAVRPGLPYPELLDRENGLRKSLAEQVRTGTMSLLERNAQLSKLHKALIAEEEARLSAAPEARPKSPRAVIEWRASNPDACGGLGGNTANCF
ncbi:MULTISPECIES: hypothetical protein [Bradyrhizobium]|jgi:hypothetical protein|uniref:hypothetical protein n=1 Tax=Bradyrhizobium TaxID=374 RepID=UPI00293E1F63|nr:hypothetical protein [Bradyrhizobium sp. NDS-1]WOH72271.1 hypothetical protein RX330_28890 [Bradyrhizobium sp. NDS-1]